MRLPPICLTCLCLICLAGIGRAADNAKVLDLWPGKAPGEAGSVGEEKITGKKGGRSLTNVSKPTITVYRPAKDKDTGAAVVIAPGGGYRVLAWDHEGEDVAAWLNSIGVTGVLLKYRVPRRADHPKGPLADAQRALSLVRGKAKEWNINPKKIGMLGFSAGGHLTALTATNFDKRAYEPLDEADKESCRPDFAVIVYPGGVVKRGTDEMDPALRVSEETPPTFLTQASDDRVGVDNSVMLYLALKKAGVPVEMHLYATGGHGYGLRPEKRPASEWTKRCEEWLRVRGVLAAKAAQ